MNHQWGSPVTYQFKTERSCLRPGCNLIKVTMHQPSEALHRRDRGRGAMTETETKTEVVAIPYPTGICEEPFTLDGVMFVPWNNRTMEKAVRDGVEVGDVLLDDNRFWFARKFDAHGELSDWKPMRCAAEARAFLVSKIRQ